MFGRNNTATGVNVLFTNTTGEADTANGSGALFANTTADFNTAMGLNALKSQHHTGSFNTATGVLNEFLKEHRQVEAGGSHR